MAAQFNLSPNDLITLLEAQGVSSKSLRAQIQAGVLWPELVQGRYRDRVRVSDDEIEDTMERMQQERRRYLDIGFVGHIPKPVNEEVLLQAIEDILKANGRHTQAA